VASGWSVLGSVQLTVPSGGTTPTRVRSYQPYGRPRTTDRTSTDRAWLGQFEDQTTGLDHLDNRYYDPAIGRFISPDPLFGTERPQTVNPYAYGINNPTICTDPSGLVAMDCISGAGGCTRPGKSWGVAPRPPVSSQFPCAQGSVRTGSGPCRPSVLRGPVIRNGPPMSRSDLDELMAATNEIRNLRPRISPTWAPVARAGKRTGP
jgi:RHS repeat-associated protein